MFFVSTPFVGEGGSRLVGHHALANAIHHLPLRPNEADLAAAPNYYSSSHHQHTLHSLNQLPAAFSMAAYQNHQDELAQLQELSNNYEPEATGPLVSDRLSSTAITAEYAKADPIYQVKTAALPQTYAQMRTLRGDGLCGWRAVIFGYYESLLRLGDKQKILEEETRLKSLHNILNQVGYQEYIYEIWADEAFLLLQEVAASIGQPDDEAALLAAFNDDNRSKSIMTYFKCLTSAWLQTHPDQFQPHVEKPIREYCAIHIEPTAPEIDYVGITALADMLVNPVGLVLEILYLDRSAGAEGNTHRWGPTGQNGMVLANQPAIRLLYRPGHYDILYKLEDLSPRKRAAPSAQDVYVALNHASTQTYHAPIFGSGYGFQEIPGMSLYNANMNWSASPQFDFGASVAPAIPHPVSRSAPTPSYAPTPMISPPAPQYVTQPPLEMPPAVSSLQFQQTTHYPMTGPFRPSRWIFGGDLNFTAGPPAQSTPYSCQTSPFKQSEHNTGHYLNEHFQPEQWDPAKDLDGAKERTRKKSRTDSS